MTSYQGARGSGGDAFTTDQAALVIKALKGHCPGVENVMSYEAFCAIPAIAGAGILPRTVRAILKAADCQSVGIGEAKGGGVFAARTREEMEYKTRKLEAQAYTMLAHVRERRVYAQAYLPPAALVPSPPAEYVAPVQGELEMALP